MAVALTAMERAAVLLALGLAISTGALAGAAYLHRRQVRVLPPLASHHGRPLADLVVAAVAVAPGVMLATWLKDAVGTSLYSFGAGLLAVAVSGLTYLAVQWLRGSPELGSLFATLARSPARDGGRERVRPGSAQPRTEPSR
jgi:hypothetical protein